MSVPSSLKGPSVVWENSLLYIVRVPPHAHARVRTPKMPSLYYAVAPTVHPIGTYMASLANALRDSLLLARIASPIGSLQKATTWPVAAASSDGATSTYEIALVALQLLAFASYKIVPACRGAGASLSTSFAFEM